MDSRSPGPPWWIRTIADESSSGSARAGDRAVDAFLHELDGGVVRPFDDDDRHAPGGSFDHDEPVAFTTRREDEAKRSRQRPLEHGGVHEARRFDIAFESVRCNRSQDLRTLRPVAEDLATKARDLAARLRKRRDERRHALLGDVPSREHRDRPRRFGLRARRGPGELPLQPRQISGETLSPEPLLVEPREAEGSLGCSNACPLNSPAEPAAHLAQIFAPVRARPNLVPVHEKPEVSSLAYSCRSQ